MPSRLQKTRPLSVFSRSRDSVAQAKYQNTENDPPNTGLSDESRRTTPAPASPGTTNDSTRANGATMAESKYNPFANSPKSANGKIPSTIRTVPSFDAPSETSSGSRSARHSGFSSSVNSNASGVSYFSQSQNGSTAKFRENSPEVDTQTARSQMSSSNTTLKASDGVGDTSISLQVPGTEDMSRSVRETSPQWDGAVGKAALGKTGRVINKLVTDNESLKRDIKIERMKAEESKQTAKLMEDKMERMASDYESRLLEANVTKTLLSRKERQVEHLQSTIDLEKKRTAEALAREHTWKDELEKGRREATVQVEEARTHAALADGRYNAIASHWKDQGDAVKQKAAGLRDVITTLVEERKQDDDKISTLRDLCDQQDGNIRDLKKQKDQIAEQFDKYKQAQEALLRDIKIKAAEREEEQVRTLEESKKVLGQLKWALNLKKNLPGSD